MSSTDDSRFAILADDSLPAYALFEYLIGADMALPIPLDRFLGCILGEAIGDSLGAPFEGLPADFVFWHSGSVSEILDREPDGPIRYTDDTQMLIGVAESLLADGEIRPATLIKHFAADYEPERGYGTGARQILEAASRGEDWGKLAQSVFPGGSFGNGAAMRVAPVGLVFAHDLDRVSEQAVASAWPTHRHALGVEGARLLALAVALASRGPPLDRREFYRQLLRGCEQEEFVWQLRAARGMRENDSLGFLGNSLPAHRSVVTAIACFTSCPKSYERCIVKAISLGDDTDTLAAMAGALSGAHLGLNGIPSRWLKNLEEGPKGAQYLHSLAERLHRFHSGLASGSSYPIDTTPIS
jgi:poly(ADP-ribose) glycohydrolase ARH3